MNPQQTQRTDTTAYPSHIVQTAFNIWERLEAMAAELWDIFGDEFVEIDEQRTTAKEQMRMDSEDDLPF